MQQHQPTERVRRVDFEDPPVVETLIGLQFAPVQGWGIPHYGLFWSVIRKEYPRFEVRPPLGSELELRFGTAPQDPTKPLVELQTSLPVRCWFFDQSETRLIQLQNNCFVHNWRKTAATQTYQHYDVIKPIFEREWLRYQNFLKDSGLSTPKVWQCEVTYVNHIDRGAGWQNFADLPKVFAPWSGKTSDPFLPEPEVTFINAVYPLREGVGQLQVALQPAVRQSDQKEIMQLTLTARGKPASSELQDILAWLDLGHDWVVNGFKSVTTPEMHRRWKVIE